MIITENVIRCRMKRVHGTCSLQEQGKISKQNNISENQNRYFTYVYIETGKGDYLYSRRENPVIIFHLVSIIKYNNIFS
jgi:hypothetical protein